MRACHQLEVSDGSWVVRRFRYNLPLFLALLGAASVSPACSSDSGNIAPINIGRPDRTNNGRIAVDESRLSASLSNGTLTLAIPVSVTGASDASGALNVRLIDVAGTNVLASTTSGYRLKKGESATLAATLPLSTPLTQADLVRYSVRIDEGAADGLLVTRSLLYSIPMHEVRLEGPGTLSKGKNVSYRVEAQNPVTRSPMAGVPVTITVARDQSVVQTFTDQTSNTGDVVFPLHLDEAGSYQVSASATAQGFSPTVSDSMNVVDAIGPKLLLTTDKPLYKPGQTLHLRALALTREANKPIASGSAIFEVEDGKGNKIFKKSITTDGHGIAATTFTLGQIVNLGDFKVRVSIGDTKSEKTVTVSQYALPKFDIALKTEKPWYRAGDIVTGTIDARYFFGKLVSNGNVVIEAASIDVGQTPFQKVMGTLDPQGHYQFSFQLPSILAGTPLEQGKAAVALRATVTDTAGQQVEKQLLITVSRTGLVLTVVPESTDVIPGVNNDLLVFVTDPIGNPVADAKVELNAPDGSKLAGTTDSFGQAIVTWATPVGATSTLFNASVSVGGSAPVTQEFNFGVQSGTEHVVVRTDKPVYQIGDTARIEVTSTHDGRNIYVDWLNDGQAVDMRTLKAVQGKASFTMSVDTSLMGSNRVEAYVVDDDGNIVRAGRTVFARNGHALDVSLTTDKTVYAPGEPAKLTFSVKDEAGNPAVAALGVQVVDQAVFSLVDAHPGLLRTFFELEDAYAKPKYEIAGPNVDFDQILFGSTADPKKAQATENLARASFAALGQSSMTGIAHGSWVEVTKQAATALEPSYDAARAQLRGALTTLAGQIVAEMNRAGCALTYLCQGVPRDEFIRARFDRLRAFDFWGNAYRSVPATYGSVTLVTSGPDERADTADDKTMTFSFGELDPSLSQAAVDARGGFGVTGTGTSGAGGSGIGGGAAGAGGGSLPPSGSGDAPRVRQDFPETLYVNPAVITAADGTATVSVDMADSITEWRVSTLASSADGRLGGSEHGVTVFQDFFVDINFPATLTRGDEVSFPMAVYNYLSEPQTVKLDLQVEDWFTATGVTSTSIDLMPGQVTGVSFPVRVDKVGLRTLTVKASGTKKSDAVARTVRVVPDGKLFSSAFSGMLATGNAGRSFLFPDTAVPGSGQLYVEVYPAFLSQVVSGMDSMLQTPNGCFEQTTSTTWPNVLVTDYMQKTRQITPAIQLKAESLISAGYQRLLTYEHPGGGFSWFGTQDGHPYLSVTAFGLMEFTDMAKVANVDEAMIGRTRQWLASAQQADGSWLGDQSEFFTFNASTLRNTAFVLWALASAGDTGQEIMKGASYLKGKLAAPSEDAYTLGIVANALQSILPDDPATAKVYEALVSRAKRDGEKVSWDTGGTQTSFYGSGDDANVSATALALNALLLRGGNKDLVDGALKYLTSSKDPQGNFGSTQATIWTLRALLLAVSKGSEGAVGDLIVAVDGTPAQTVHLTADQSDVMTMVDLSTFAGAGSRNVSLAFAGTGQVSFNAVGKYNLPWAQVSDPPDGPLTIGVAYDKTSLYVNDTVKATVTVHNNTASTENMILVTVGLPPGFEVMTDDLSPYLNSHLLSKFELTGKQLTLYVSTLGAQATSAFSYRLRATMPVRATDGGAEAHLYYEPAKSAHAAASQVEAKAN